MNRRRDRLDWSLFTDQYEGAVRHRLRDPSNGPVLQADAAVAGPGADTPGRVGTVNVEAAGPALRARETVQRSAQHPPAAAGPLRSAKLEVAVRSGRRRRPDGDLVVPDDATVVDVVERHRTLVDQDEVRATRQARSRAQLERTSPCRLLRGAESVRDRELERFDAVGQAHISDHYLPFASPHERRLVRERLGPRFD